VIGVGLGVTVGPGVEVGVVVGVGSVSGLVVSGEENASVALHPT